MNRKSFLIAAVVVFITLAIVAVRLVGRDPHAPRFIPGSPASIPTFKWNHYEWMADAPFENNKLWLWTVSGKTNSHAYLYDLQQRAVVGELVDGGVPELCSRDGTRIMVRGYGSGESLERRAINFVRKMFGAKALPAGNQIEMLWFVDLSKNSAVRLGAVSQLPGAGSFWYSSPDFRYGYTMPSTAFDAALFLCDLNQRSLTRIPVRGNAAGWWGDRDILIVTPKNEFDLLNIDTRTTRKLFTSTDIQMSLTGAGVTNASVDLYPFHNWNGSNFDFYFGLKDKVRGLHGDSFLLKANRAGPSLELLYPNFGYSWGGCFDSSGNYYLFQGESGKPGSGGNGGVYLRNLKTDAVTTVVPPDNKGQYAIPRFYGNEVIYFKDRVLHRIGIDGSNDAAVLSNAGK